MTNCAIFGIGNLLLGDDGVGPAVISYLEAQRLVPPGVTIADLGPPSLNLVNHLAGYDRVIFVDAVPADEPPGTVRRYTREQITGTAPGTGGSPHEPAINDALALLDYAGDAPKDVVLVGIVPGTFDGGIALSPAVAGAVPLAAVTVLAELASVPELTRRRLHDRRVAVGTT